MYNVGNLIFDATMVVATLWIVNKYLQRCTKGT